MADQKEEVVWHFKWLTASYALFVGTFITADILLLSLKGFTLSRLISLPYFPEAALLLVMGLLGVLAFKKLK